MKTINKRGPSALHKRAWKRISRRSHLCAQYVRCVTGHAPTGQYRERFHPEHNTRCQFCEPDAITGLRPLFSTSHILQECVHYTLPEWDTEYHPTSRADFLQFLKDSSHADEALLKFLMHNPTSFTFTDLDPD